MGDGAFGEVQAELGGVALEIVALDLGVDVPELLAFLEGKLVITSYSIHYTKLYDWKTRCF